MRKIFLLFQLICLFFACIGSNHPLQIKGLSSFSKKYIIEVPIKKINNMHYWIVTIKNSNKITEYQDEETNLAARFNIYWCWDKNDNLWVYNSDDGFYFFWSKVNDKWIKYKWDATITTEIPDELKFENIYKTRN